MSTQYLEILTFISSASVIVPLLISLIRIRNLNSTQKILATLLSLSLITELVANVLWYQNINNLPVYNVFSIINFNFLVIIFSQELKKTWKVRLLGYQVLLTLFAVFNAIWLQKLSTFNSNFTTAASLSLIILGLLYFIKILREVRFQRLEKNPMFWINSGIIIYYSGTLILFVLSNQINDADANSFNLHLAAWGLNSIFNLILITAYSLALWVKPTK